MANENRDREGMNEGQGRGGSQSPGRSGSEGSQGSQGGRGTSGSQGSLDSHSGWRACQCQRPGLNSRTARCY